MTIHWRIRPDGMPRQTEWVLWCLIGAAGVIDAIATLGLTIGFPRAAREAGFWLSFLICATLPVLAVASWGLVFRRFAFGSAWIAATLTVSGLISGCFAAIVIVDARGKDSIGHGVVLLFGTPLLYLALIVGSAVLYVAYRKRRFRRVSQVFRTASTDRSDP